MTKIRVRMYRGFLGDCFLLTFGDNRAHMLIDCGVIGGTPAASNLMKQVARDILDATGGRLDLLVATHEHWDHLSGFVQARDIFEGIDVKNVWLAWTEDPKDELARSLCGRRRQARAAVAMAIDRLKALGAEGAHSSGHLDGIMSFYGDQMGAAARGAVACPVEEAMKWVAERPRRQAAVLFSPGDAFLPGRHGRRPDLRPGPAAGPGDD